MLPGASCALREKRYRGSDEGLFADAAKIVRKMAKRAAAFENGLQGCLNAVGKLVTELCNVCLFIPGF